MFIQQLLLVTALAFLSLNFNVSAATDKVICYWGTWSHYRQGNGQFNALTIDPSLCTHVIYTFFGLEDSAIVSLDPWLDISLGMLNKTNDLKKINPNLKTLLAVGGWNQGSLKYSNMAADATTRAIFISSALKCVEDYGFDGLDLDWEYPARRGGAAADKENFSTLLKEMYPVFNNKGLLLTAAVSAVPSQTDLSYEVPVLNKYLDHINLMLYDYYGAWDTTTGFNAPFNSSSRYAGTEYSDLNVVDCVQGWITRGASPQKLSLGVPFYGRTFTLSSTSSNGVGSAASGAGLAGPYTQTAGFLGYNEIIEKFTAGGWTQVWDSESQVPYAYNGNQWISYDNPESLTVKINYAKSLDIGAIMLWSIETDDFKGLSGTSFPLLKAIKTALGTDSSSSSGNSSSNSEDSSSNDSDSNSDLSSGIGGSDKNTSDDSSSDNSGASNSSDSCNIITESSSDDSSDSSGGKSDDSDGSAGSSDSSDLTFTCTKEGMFRYPSDCTKYYVCTSSLQLEIMSCGSLYFDQSLSVCNWPANVADCN